MLVLSPEVLAVGCSARTSAQAIEKLAETLFSGPSSVREVLVIQIPFKRAYMHLDTVFTMVDRDKFIIFPEIEPDLRVFRLTPGEGEGADYPPSGQSEGSPLRVPGAGFRQDNPQRRRRQDHRGPGTVERRNEYPGHCPGNGGHLPAEYGIQQHPARERRRGRRDRRFRTGPGAGRARAA